MNNEINREEYFDFLVNTGVIYEIMGCIDEAYNCWLLAEEIRRNMPPN